MAPRVLPPGGQKAVNEGEGQDMRRLTLSMLGLMALLVGFTACAKYPVVTHASAPAPTATMSAPSR
jgi:hypothetical protein